jgi:DNA repair protein RecN (Recombination protein N)
MSARQLLSREITAEGKSSCRINGMPTTAAVLRELCGGLININGQHDSVGLLNPAHHLSILDDYAQNDKLYQEYYVLYRSLVKVKKELDAMITDEAEKQRRIDLLSYQVQEIEEAGLTAGEEQTLEARRKVLANASTIRDRVAKAHALLSGDDDTPGAVDLLGEASNAMDTAAQLDESLSGVSGTLMDLYYSAKDAAAELIDRLDAYDTNDAELDEIEQRLDLLYRLKRKYGDTVEDIIAFGQKAREELEQIQFSEQRHDQLQAEKLRLYGLAREKAEALTQTRLKAFDELNARITDTLQFLNMPGVRMTLYHARGPLASHGQDSVEFYISTNAGEAPKPLARIASGGELSRITLAIKNALADRDAVPTVIYDEIDSGVSGKAAGRIGEVLRQSAQGHQILCITHTAQIAALADCHLLIRKNVTNDRTYTEIHPLDTEGRVEALARLISGDHVTELSRANAREMLGTGRQ